MGVRALQCRRAGARVIYVVQVCAREGQPRVRVPVPPDCSIVLWGRQFGDTTPIRKRLGARLRLGQSHSGVAEDG